MTQIKSIGRLARPKGGSAPWLLRIAMILAVLMIPTISYAGNYEYGPEIVVSECTPAAGQEVESVQTITFVFDCTKAFSQYSDITSSNFVIPAVFTASKTVRLYKGTAESGELLASVPKTRIKGTVGEVSVTFELEKECALIGGQLYTLTWDADIFYIKGDGLMVPDDAYTAAGSYSFYGATSASSVFELVDYSPGINSPLIEDFSLVFTQDVVLAPNATARLYESDTLLGEASLSVSSEDEKTVEGKFDKIPLYYSHNYTLAIDEGTIREKNTDKAFDAIQLNYNGTAYKYFSYGRITPSNNSEVSYLSTISVPCKGIENGYTLYNVDAPYVKMYEGDDTEPMAEIRCTLNTTSDGWEIPVWNFNLKPSTTYRLVLAADQSKLWEPGERVAFVKVEDTSNSELILTYTTPAILEEAPSITLGESTPGDTDAISFIDRLIVSIESFDFETINYLPTLIVENPEAKFMQDGELIKSAPIALDFVQSAGQDGQGVLKIEINETLLKGHNYEVVIPEGILGPAVGPTMTAEQRESFQNAVKNKERVFMFYGNTPTEATVTYYIGETGSMSTVVKVGETVTVNVAGSEDWKVEELLFNGSPVTIEGSEYVTPGITEDATIAVTYAYAHDIPYDYTTGVVEPGDCPYALERDGEHLVITGLNAGDSIAIYTLGGIKVIELTDVPADRDRVAIALQPSQYYIILINDIAIRYKH